jgi:hypothetical protein
MSKINHHWLYNKFDPLSITRDVCFMCLEKFTEENYNTKEHVIPQWIIRDFKLQDHEIIYLWNRINYTHYVIPCCYNCHQTYLNPVEEKVSREFKKWFSSFKQINKDELYLRLCKVIYWLMRKKQFLTRSRRPIWDLNDDVIIPPDYLEEYRMLYQFLQMYKFSFEFSSKPYSIFIVEINDWRKETQFYFRDNIEQLFISFQLGAIWIICVYQDNGHIFDHITEIYPKLFEKPIHPLQFIELSALVQSYLWSSNFVPKYITHFNNTTKDHITITPYWSPRDYKLDMDLFSNIFWFALEHYSDQYFGDEWYKVKRPEKCWFIYNKNWAIASIKDVDDFLEKHKPLIQ